MTSSLQKLQRLLRRLFRLGNPDDAENSGDLDFGIYRVAKLKEKRLSAYVDEQLPKKIGVLLEKASRNVEEGASSALNQARQRVIEALSSKALDSDDNLTNPVLAETPAGAHYERVRAAAAGVRPVAVDIEEMREEIHDHLANFFARYECGGGDIVPQRRHSVRNRYALPHNGEEVLLHWANRDQYYIKTAALHSSIAFKADGKRFRFQISEATDIPRDNNKDGRFLLPQIAKAAKDENGDIVVPFVFRALSKAEQNRRAEAANGESGNGSKVQRGILAEALADLEKAAEKNPDLRPMLQPHMAQREKSVFAVHAARFVRRNNEDFFIHRNLRKFLSEELDFYLKNETLNADELAGLDGFAIAARLTIFRAVREIAADIIDALAEWENLQKALWEKKKFVLQTEYCATLGHIPNAKKSGVLDDIAKCDKQWAEWKTLGVKGETALFSPKGGAAKRMKFLDNNPSLPVDTGNFPPEFKDLLLAQFSDIDDATDGVLIHGENWQALNLIQEMYRGRVKCVYIDPPYNTDASAILYKNDYKHSSWLSMMDGRLRLTPALMTADGILCAAIDDEEQSFLRILLSSVFEKELGVVPVRSNPAGRKTSGRFAPSHEYALFWGVSDDAMPGSLPKDEKGLAVYPHEDAQGRYIWTNFIRSGSNDKREDRPTMFYPIYVGADDKIRVPKMEWDGDKNEWRILEKPASKETAVWPLGKNGDGNHAIEKNWHRGNKRVVDEPDEYRVRRSSGGVINIDFKKRMDEESMPNTWWGSSKYASAVQGTSMLKGFFGEKDFDFPKSLGLVEDCLRASGLGQADFALDYFAGSGTTAHAVVNLNREDGGRRKFILAEMGDYFNTVLLPRVKKITYAPGWKDGEAAHPAARKDFERGPRLVKYQRIESYEDTLANIRFEPNGLGLGDFRPRYELDFESRGCPARLLEEGLDSPFRYGLELTLGNGENGERTRTETADLAETFSYLSGFRVRRRRVLRDGSRDYLALRGICGGRETAVIWRDTADWEAGDYERDRAFIEKEGLADGADWILTNGASSLKGADSLNPLFGAAMFSGTGEEDEDE